MPYFRGATRRPPTTARCSTADRSRDAVLQKRRDIRNRTVPFGKLSLKYFPSYIIFIFIIKFNFLLLTYTYRIQ